MAPIGVCESPGPAVRCGSSSSSTTDIRYLNLENNFVTEVPPSLVSNFSGQQLYITPCPYLWLFVSLTLVLTE